MQDGSRIPATEAEAWLRKRGKVEPITIQLTPTATLTIHRRKWSAEEQQRLARILFAPHSQSA